MEYCSDYIVTAQKLDSTDNTDKKPVGDEEKPSGNITKPAGGEEKPSGYCIHCRWHGMYM